jgi:hypothetical protein
LDDTGVTDVAAPSTQEDALPHDDILAAVRRLTTSAAFHLWFLSKP